MMTNRKRCPNCDGNTLYASKNISASGGSPNLLPGLGRGFFSMAEFHIVICKDCGLMQLFAEPEPLAKLAESNKWARI